MDRFLLDRSHPPRRVVYRDRERQLVLRPWGFQDVDPLLAAIEASAGELREFMIWAHGPLSRDGEFQIIRNFMAQYWAGREYVFGSFAEDGALLGGLGLHPRTALNPRALEVGYWCHSAHAGQGLTTLAVRALVAVAFDCLDCDRLQVAHDQANVRSQRVIEKCGFRYEGTLKNATVEVAPGLRTNGYLGTPLQRLYALTPDDLAGLDWLPGVRANLLIEDALGGEHHAPFAQREGEAAPEAENQP